MNREIALATPHGPLPGQLTIPPAARGLVLLVEPDSAPPVVPPELTATRLAVLSLPLLAPQEGHFPDAIHNVPRLAQRLADLLQLVRGDGDTENLPVGLLASGHAVPAAVRAAALRDAQVRALVCRGGLIDLAGLENLRFLASPLLMLVDADDAPSQASFERAARHLSCPHRLVRLAPRESSGSHAARWFEAHLQAI